MAPLFTLRLSITVCILLLVPALFASCSKSPAGAAEGVSPAAAAPTEQGWQGSLPSPAKLKLAGYTFGDLRQPGSNHLGGFAQNVSLPGGESAAFSPDFDSGEPGSALQAAWAVYGFQLEDYSLGTQFELEFSAAGDYSNLWLGLADWQAGHWRWYDLGGPQSSQFGSGLTASFIDDDSSMLYAAVVCTGTAGWTLDAISINSIGQQDYPNTDAKLGMNLAGVPDWGRAWVFVDVFKHARDWISQPSDNSSWDDGRDIPVDENGWPTSLLPDQYAGNVLLTSQFGNYPSGEYICLYDGDGSINFRLDASIVSQTPGRIVVQINPEGDGLTQLQITSTSQSDPVRNIRLLMPGYETTYEQQLFHPVFLDSLRYYSVLRFMDFQETNGSPNQYWADRTTPEYFNQASEKGVCVEYMVELANRVGADPWFCMPHLADDEFIREFATYVRENLNADLRVYVEHSNEVWNGIFAQAGHARQRGLDLGLSANPNQAQLYYHSRRSVEIFAIWEEVFGGTERLVRVLSSQHANPWTAEQVLGFEDAYLHADALATAPYFGGSLGSPDNAEETKAMSIAEVLAACDASSTANAATTADNYVYAVGTGLQLIAYEGGQHLVGTGSAQNDDDLTAHLQAANRDGGMRQVYLNDLTRWETEGGGMFCAFSHIGSYSKYGSWGAMEFMEQDPADSPKLLGLLDYAGLVP